MLWRFFWSTLEIFPMRPPTACTNHVRINVFKGLSSTAPPFSKSFTITYIVHRTSVRQAFSTECYSSLTKAAYQREKKSLFSHDLDLQETPGHLGGRGCHIGWCTCWPTRNWWIWTVKAAVKHTGHQYLRTRQRPQIFSQMAPQAQNINGYWWRLCVFMTCEDILSNL